jgi:hypothetical protein
MDIKVLRTIWTSQGQERLCQVTLSDGETRTAWYREHDYHRLTTYGEPRAASYTPDQIRSAMIH